MIRLDDLSKIFNTPSGDAVAVDHVSMEVSEGEICILLGPSGCGKTTTLKMINRIISPTSGGIFIDDKDTSEIDTTTLRRRIGYVIQQIGLFPNMTIEENISVVPKLLGWDRARTARRVDELLEMVALDPEIFRKRYPKELSGGQQQRIGVARALAADPPILLMDEPFGAIDPINREVIQDEFLRMQEKLKKTILFVSHDVNEAVKMGDKIAIFRSGKLEQFDTPDNILAHPANAFIADFVGNDRTLKRLSLLKVGKVMDSSPPRVQADSPLDEAIALMRETGYESIMIVGLNGRPQGVIHRSATEGRRGCCQEHQSELKVAVRVEDDLRTAISQMFTHDLNWLPVVDSEGIYRGYITQHGITRTLARTYQNAAHGRQER